MRTFLAACVAVGAVSVAALPQARADELRIGVPGAHLNIGGHDREAREHRDWDRHAYEHRDREVVRERCVGRDCR
jgi:hypothetical protein